MSLCWFQCSIGNTPCNEKIIFELFDSVTPKTCKNFRTLCTGEAGKVPNTDVPLSYKGCTFHRIIKKFMIQGGDFTNHNGTGGVSIYGEKFDDENFQKAADRPGLLAMANAGPNTNGSQFFITTVATPHLTGKHVVFGRVLRGMSVVRQLENTETGMQDRPVAPCVITDCGVMEPSELPEVQPPADGDTYADYPEDGEELTDDKLLEVGKSVRAIGNKYFTEGEVLKATEKYGKALRYLEAVADTSAIHDTLVEAKVACNNNAAMCFIKLEKWTSAIQSASAALRDDSNNVKALYRRGVATLRSKDFDMAKADFEKVLELDPNNSDAQDRLREVKSAMAQHEAKMALACKKMFS